MTVPGPALPAEEEVRRLLGREYGLTLTKITREQVERAAALAGGATAAAPPTHAWLEAVLDHLPIEESWLFRDAALWRWLRDDVVPPLLARSARNGEPARILSLGCSVGQEAFSLATLLWRGGAESVEQAVVLGVDPSRGRIAQAESGVLDDWSIRRTPRGWLTTGEVVTGTPDGRWRVAPEVRALCRFEVGNLLDWAGGRKPVEQYDVVLCRHVLIYFAPEQAREVVAGIAGRLRAGAVLVVGPSEGHLLSASRLLESTGYISARARRRSETPCEQAAKRSGAAGAAGRAGRGRGTRLARAEKAPPGRGRPDAEVALAPVRGDAPAGAVVQRWLAARELADQDRAGARKLLGALVDELRGRSPGELVEENGDVSVAQILAAALPLLTELDE